MSSGEEEDDLKKPRGRQSALEQQKLHLTKLMANPVRYEPNEFI